MLLVGEGIDVRSQAGRGGGIHASHMMVYANLMQGQPIMLDGSLSGREKLVAYMFAGVTGLLLQKVDKVRRTKFAEGDERLGAGVDGLL